MNLYLGLLGPTKAARLLGVHRRTLDRWVKNGLLKRDPASGMFCYGELKRLQEARYPRIREQLIARMMDNFYFRTDRLPF